MLPKGNRQNSGNERVTIMTKEEVFNCPVTATLDKIGGKWRAHILYQLTSGTKRFGEIAVRIPGISRKVLTEQLKELEKDGLITRKQYKEIPPRVEYTLTPMGMSLSLIFDEMARWGKEHLVG